MGKVLVVGSGGREHALAWKLSQSQFVSKLYCAPGNPGMADIAELIDIDVNDFEGLGNFARNNKIILTVVGPEIPLVNGIVDYWQEEGLEDAGYKIFGPNKAAAALEGSKVFAKEFMKRHDIPTAPFRTFSNPEEAIGYLRERGAPIVVKADGLAAGKGSIVCKTLDIALDAIYRIMVKKEFKEAGNQVVIEDFMHGEEASVLALVDGATILTFVSSQDHKPAFETVADRENWLKAGGDQRYKDYTVGPNTGGMGAYAPAPIITDDIMRKVYDRILAPTLNGLREEGITFRGCLYAGLMIYDGDPNVVEDNVRFGDPEAQPVLSLLESDLFSLLYSSATGTLKNCRIQHKKGAACCVVMASGGYPGDPVKGRLISGLDKAGVNVFHAGTKSSGEGIVTAGGRVLGVTAIGDTLMEAIDAAYRGVGKISWRDEYHRTDIGARALR